MNQLNLTHGFLNDVIVVRNFLGVDWLLKWPAAHVCIQSNQNLLALLFKSLLFTLPNT